MAKRKEHTGRMVQLSATFNFENGAKQVIKMMIEKSSIGDTLSSIKSDLRAVSYDFQTLK